MAASSERIRRIRALLAPNSGATDGERAAARAALGRMGVPEQEPVRVSSLSDYERAFGRAGYSARRAQNEYDTFVNSVLNSIFSSDLQSMSFDDLVRCGLSPEQATEWLEKRKQAQEKAKQNAGRSTHGGRVHWEG